MSLALGRRMAMVTTAAALSVGALIMAAGSASAADIVPISTSHWVGLYNGPSTDDGVHEGLRPIAPGGRIFAQCWTAGQSIGNYGNTWYRTSNVDYNDGQGWLDLDANVYVFAGYADNNARTVNRDPKIPQC